MTWSPDSSITGGTITGFTTPAFTQVDDTPPAINAKQKTVTALSGTLTATANSASSPFTSTFYKPTAPKGLPTKNANGSRGAIPKNQYKLVIRKGGLVDADTVETLVARLTIDVPAGMEVYSPNEVNAFVSYLVGLLNEESNDLAETLRTNVL